MPLLHQQQNRTYNYYKKLLTKYTQEKNLKQGKTLHALILKTCSFTDLVYLSNTLLNLYSKCGLLHHAASVFSLNPIPDVVSWNSLINAHSHRASSSSSATVLDLFRRLRAHNTLPNAHTFSGVFTSIAAAAAAANSGGFFFVGLQAHALAVKLDGFRDVFVGSSLVNMYCKVGFVVEARKVFDRMPERNSVSWSSMISGYAVERMVFEALGLFDLMRRDVEEEGDVNEFVFTSVVSTLSDPQFVDCGRQVHGLLLKNGLLAFVSVLNSLVTLYAKCGRLDESLRIFELTSDKNAITWSAMITGHAQSGDSRKALDLFSKMNFSGIGPSAFTLVGVLNACGDLCAAQEGKQVHGYLLKLGFEFQLYIMTALVDMYAKSGYTKDALKGFDYLQQPDIVLWTSMIAGHVKNRENEEALSLYCRMQMEGIVPNELTMASVLKACSNLAALDQGVQIHAHTIKYGVAHAVSIGSALSTMYSKCGSLEEGNQVFRTMQDRDVVSWNAMISGLAQNGYGKEAVELFDEMRLEGTKPDNVTFVNVLGACSHMGLVDRAWEYFRIMFDEYGIVPSVEHYACMVDVLTRAEKLNEAKEFIEWARIDHGLCLWRIVLSACRNHRNYELGAYAGEKLMELGSAESSAYVLLSSIYTALNKPEDVERVRRLMSSRGVSKEPGCSWIELKSRVHVFVVGDQMHPKIEEIRKTMRRLSRQMKDKSYRPAGATDFT